MTEGGSEDTATIAAALAYVTELYHELTDENGAPTLGTQNQVVDFIRGDPELSAYVRGWAATQPMDQPLPVPPMRLPLDAAYERIAAHMRAVMERPVFERARPQPP